LRGLLPKVKRRGRKLRDRRLILNGIFYMMRTGCDWEYDPSDFGPWKTLYAQSRYMATATSIKYP
jgi:putative transposase